MEGLNSKIKLELYKTLGKKVEFKRYLHGVSDARTRLLFICRSGTHGLNEELGRHRGRNGRTECIFMWQGVCGCCKCFMGVSYLPILHMMVLPQ